MRNFRFTREGAAPALALAIATAPLQVGTCEVTGAALLSAYDRCFWEYETDDALHPGVEACVESARAQIRCLGECAAKHQFKARICELARQQQAAEIDPNRCLADDRALGPVVEHGEI